MEKIIDFVVQNWRIIVDVCGALFCLVMFLVRKKPIKVVDTIYQELLSLVLSLINEAERYYGSKTGSNKRTMVLSMVHEWIVDKHPEVDTNLYMKFASDLIELVLSTPQKKGEK